MHHSDENHKKNPDKLAFLKGVKYVSAPMVSASELPWRMMLREKYKVDLCFSPMLNSKSCEHINSFNKHFQTCPEDRPLVVQICGNEKDLLLKLAKRVEDKCDCIDLNLGCPQQIAKKGNFGAFLAEDWDLIEDIIRHLSQNISIAISAKIRVFESLEKTISYAQMLVRAGVDLITVHGRTKEEKNFGFAKLDYIREIKKAVNVPIITNGNIQCFEDIQKTIKITGCDIAMSADGILFNPGLFNHQNPKIHEAAALLIIYCQKFDPDSLRCCKYILYKYYSNVLEILPQFANKIAHAKSYQRLLDLNCKLGLILTKLESLDNKSIYNTNLGLPFWFCQSKYRSTRDKSQEDPPYLAQKERLISVFSMVS